ncbi:MAG: 2OG-Fe(II) oxygenase [Chitinophagales bacterium]|nr:2OG-Fe(II) oxygenase [Chitinophagales bacterium]
MQPVFDTLIQRFIDTNVGISQNFLPDSLAISLKENLLTLLHNKQFTAAGTGNKTSIHHDKLVRSDLIYWLDHSHNTVSENAFFTLMDSFVKYLNSTCYTGITGYEFHYAVYEKGSFYSKHLDQFKNDKSRAYSVIFYLNEAWKSGDGGELRIHHPHHIQTIAPENGTCVFFKSNELIHEVLLTQKTRCSITGWLKAD